MGESAAIGVQAISGAANTYSQSQAIKSQAAFQKQQFDMNQKLADLQAQEAISRGDRAAARQETKTQQTIGAQRTALAAQGISVDTGSALDVQNDTAQLGALDALTIRNNAWREAWGYKMQASQYGLQGKLGQLASENAYRNTLVTGGLNAISGGAQAYGKLPSNSGQYQNMGAQAKPEFSANNNIGSYDTYRMNS